MRGPKSPIKITLTDNERAELENLLQSNNTPLRFTRRIKVIFMLEEGHSIQHISDSVRLQRRIVREWGKRFAEKRIYGLFDVTRPGRPRINKDKNNPTHLSGKL